MKAVWVSIKKWFSDAVPLNTETLKDFGSEPVPNHLKKWWFALGGTPGICFLFLFATGVMLTFYYVPEPGKAYDSVKRITEMISYGWFVRSIHSWASNFMIIAVALHIFRVFFTGAYRPPRELNWMVGCVLFLCILMMGFTGYSLVYEQLSFWGATVAVNITQAVPFIGPYLAEFIRGGEAIGSNTLTRFFIFHVALIPTVIVILVGLHILLIRLHGVSEYHFKDDLPKEKKSFPFFPDHVLTEIAVGLAILGLLTCFAIIFPADMGPRANPAITPEHIKPEWYFFFTFRWLKLSNLTWGVLGTGGFFALMIFWPFIDRCVIRRKHKNSELSILWGVLAVVVFIALTVWEVLS